MYEVIYMHTIQPRSYGGGGGRGYGDDSQFRLHSLAPSLPPSLLPNTLARSRSPPRVLARCLVAGLAVASRVDTGGRRLGG